MSRKAGGRPRAQLPEITRMMAHGFQRLKMNGQPARALDPVLTRKRNQDTMSGKLSNESSRALSSCWTWVSCQTWSPPP